MKTFVMVMMFALGGSAYAADACTKQCADDSKMCNDVCSKHAGPQAGPHCKKACGEAEKTCQDSCKGQKK